MNCNIVDQRQRGGVGRWHSELLDLPFVMEILLRMNKENEYVTVRGDAHRDFDKQTAPPTNLQTVVVII